MDLFLLFPYSTPVQSQQVCLLSFGSLNLLCFIGQKSTGRGQQVYSMHCKEKPLLIHEDHYQWPDTGNTRNYYCFNNKRDFQPVEFQRQWKASTARGQKLHSMPAGKEIPSAYFKDHHQWLDMWKKQGRTTVWRLNIFVLLIHRKKSF